MTYVTMIAALPNIMDVLQAGCNIRWLRLHGSIPCLAFALHSYFWHVHVTEFRLNAGSVLRFCLSTMLFGHVSCHALQLMQRTQT